MSTQVEDQLKLNILARENIALDTLLGKKPKKNKSAKRAPIKEPIQDPTEKSERERKSKMLELKHQREVKCEQVDRYSHSRLLNDQGIYVTRRVFLFYI